LKSEHHIGLMDHSHRILRPLKLAFGTCIIFATTPDEICVAADTERTIIDFEDGTEDIEPACKLAKLGVNVLGENVYTATAGLTWREKHAFDALATCKRVFGPSKSIEENLELIEKDLDKPYRAAIKDLNDTLSGSAVSAAAKCAAERFQHTLHIALFGFESETPVISAIKFVPGLDYPIRECVVGPNPFPSYSMGLAERLQHVGLMPANNQLGIKEQLEERMKGSYSYLGRKCPEYAILRVGSKGEEQWLTQSAACKNF